MAKYLLLFFVSCWHLFSFANDECANAITLTPGTSCSYTNASFSGMTMNGAGPSCEPGSLQDLWFRFTATDPTMRITLSAVSGLNHGFEIIQGGCGGTMLQCVNANGFANGETWFNNNYTPGQVYYIRVFNASASFSTASFGICIQNYPTPPNDLCANAVTLTPAAACNYTNGTFSGALREGALPSCETSASQDVWYQFTATDATMRITIPAVTGLNPGFEIFQGACNGTALQCVNNSGFGNGESYFNNNFVPGQVYYIRVFNASGALSTLAFQICVQTYPAPANDLCANATTLMPGTSCTYTAGTFSGAMMDGGVPSCATSASQDVWYKFTATDSTMRVQLEPISGLNHGFEIIQGSCSGPVWQCVNANGTSAEEFYFNNNFIPGQEYYVRVFNASGALNSVAFNICIRKYPVPSNDICANATTLIPGTSCTYTTGTFNGAMMNGGTPSCATSASQDVWYKFTATDSTMRIQLEPVLGLNHGFEIIQGNCNGPVWQCVNANGSATEEFYFNNNFIPGQVYYVRVFNTSSVLNTSSFGICIRNYPTPPNDVCANAITLVPGTSCTYTTGTFSGAMMNGGTPSCGTSASQDVWYKFTATDSTMRIQLEPVLGLNHGFEIIQGSCNGPVWQCVNANGTATEEFYFNNNFIPGQVYYVRVFNAASTLNTSSFGICIRRYPVPPNDVCANAITLIPNTSCSYTTGTFSGAMMNGGTPSCATSASQDVWYKFTATDSTMRIQLEPVLGLNHGFEIIQGNCNGPVWQCVNANGSATEEFYFNNNFIPGQVYYVRVFNASSVLNTSSFGICIRRYPSPSNDQCANAITIVPGINCSYTYGTFSGAMMNGGTPSCATSASQDVWFRFTATDSTMRVQLEPVLGLNHGFEIIQGSCNGPVWQCVNANGTATEEFYFNNNFIPGQVYYVRVFNAASTLNTSSFGICIRKYQVPVNDRCPNAIELTPGNTCSSISGTFSGAMMNGGIPSCAPNTSQDAWYKFTATATSMTVQLGAVSGLNHGFQVFEGSCSGTEIICRNQTTSGNSESYILTTLTVGQTYYVRVLNTLSSLSTSSFSICLIGTPPNACTPNVVITSSETTICQSQSVTFTATPTHGGGSPSYQWKMNGTNVGTNSPTYTTSTLSNAAMVSCVMVSSASCASPLSVTSNTITMSVTPLAAPTFTQIPAICPGGTFTLPGVSNNGIVGYWDPAVNNMATTTYTFTPDGGQCASTATMTVTVSAAAVPAFTQVPPICSGGSFTLPTTSNNGISGTWSPAINNTATTTYTFTPNPGGCTATATMTVTVNSASTTPAFTQVPAICSGGSFTLPTTSLNGIPGTWSPAINNTATTTYTFTPSAGQCATTATMTVTVNSASTIPAFNQVPAICTGGTFTLPTTSTNGINGTWSPAINNTATTTYTFTPAAGQCATTATMTVTVNPASTTPSFNQIPEICTGGTFTLPTTSTNGINGTWSPAVNNTATTTYTFTPTAGQCATTATMTVTVNPATTVPSFNQVPAICTGGTFTLPTTSTNGINGTWSPAINNTATTTYTFTPAAGQCATTATMTVTVNPASTTPSFNQVPAICTGGTFTLPTTSTNGINGTWSPAVNNTATTTYTFTPTAGQCATTATMTVTVNPATTVPSFNQVPAICTGGTFTLPTTSTNGINGMWSPAVNNTATTTYTFTPTAGQCATTATMTVTVNPATTVPSFNQVPAICTGGTFTLPTTSTNGINGTWSPAVNNTATTTYTFTPAVGQCATTATMTVTVNSGTIPSFTPIAAICSGASLTLPTVSNDGISGTWSPAINNTATTTYTFTPTSGQCVQSATMTVVVNSVNTAVTTQGNTITASATGATYHWIDCSTNQLINGATNASFTPTQNGSYAVVVTQNGCADTSNCIAITTVGVEALVQNGWTIYPNPVNEKLFIETAEAAEITIVDMAGKTILREVLKSGNNPVNVSSLTPGMYFIQSASGATVKFVKQ